MTSLYACECEASYYGHHDCPATYIRGWATKEMKAKTSGVLVVSVFSCDIFRWRVWLSLLITVFVSIKEVEQL